MTAADAEPLPSLRWSTLLLLFGTTVLAFFMLYGPQPLLPSFARRYHITEPGAALLISATMLPLSLAPLIYGSLLDLLAPMRLLRVVLVGLACAALAFVLVDTFPLLVGIRFVHGLLLPAVFTAVTTYLATAVQGARLRRVMAMYVAATIVGGYLGRLLAGLTATLFDWRIFFVLVAAALLLCSLALGRVPTIRPATRARFSIGSMLVVLRDPAYLTIYLGVFCLFFVFAGLLNYLPFRLTELHARPSELLTGLMYTGYLLGIGTSLGSAWIAARLGGDLRAMQAGFLCYIAALLATLTPAVGVLFVVLWVFCGAAFLVHAIAAGLVNQMGSAQKGTVNGFYVTFYYAGGVLGSFLPGFAYARGGWGALVLVFLLVAASGWLVLLARGRLQASQATTQTPGSAHS